MLNLQKKSIAILFFLLSTVAFAQHGVGTGWSDGVSIPIVDATKSQRGVLYNNMAVSSSGRIFVLTNEFPKESSSASPESNFYICYSDEYGDSWSEPILFEPAVGLRVFSPMKMAIDNCDFLHLVWSARDPDDDITRIYHTMYNSKLDLIYEKNIITDSKGSALHLTIDGKDKLHLMWHKGGDPEELSPSEIYHCKSNNRGYSWSTPTQLNIEETIAYFPRGQFNAAFNDKIAITWRQYNSETDWDIYLCISMDGGTTWNEPTVIVDQRSNDSDPDVIIDPSNSIHLVFHQYQGGLFGGGRILYSRSDDLGKTWKDDEFKVLSEDGIRSHLVEGNRFDPVKNILWIMWKDERDRSESDPSNSKADIIIIQSSDRGESWSTPEFATDEEDLAVGYKAGTIVRGRTSFYAYKYAINYEVKDEDGLRRTKFRIKKLPTACLVAVVGTGVEMPIELPYTLFKHLPTAIKLK